MRGWLVGFVDVLVLSSSVILLFSVSLDFYISATHLSSGVSMGAEAETLILCKVAMESPHESMLLISQCLQELYHLRPGEALCGI